jgi:hypothetical protein
MKKFTFILIVPMLFGFRLPTVESEKNTGTPHCLSQVEAEEILGQPATQTEAFTEKKDGAVKHRCTYTAKASDMKTNATGHVFYILEAYESVTSAQKIFTGMMEGNQSAPGFKHIKDLGDEAFFHTDQINFHLMIVRKGDKILRLKVNKVTSLTSLEALRKVIKELSLTL